MSEEKKQMTNKDSSISPIDAGQLRTEKIAKAKELLNKIIELDLEQDELKRISAGQIICKFFDYCKTVDNR